jgi:hypothetical protein
LVTSGKPKKGQVNGPWPRLQRFCEEKSIELVEINTVITDLISVLREKYPKPEKVGKEDGIARFLIHLNHNGFFKITSHIGDAGASRKNQNIVGGYNDK